MEMMIDFPGGARVDAHFSGFTVPTDQPAGKGGEGSAPTPFATFLASLAHARAFTSLAFAVNGTFLPTESAWSSAPSSIPRPSWSVTYPSKFSCLPIFRKNTGRRSSAPRNSAR